jgi:hypothetical protein
MLGFSCNFFVTTTHYVYPNFLNKGINLLRMQVLNYFDYPFGFVGACEDSIMVDDVATPSNTLLAPIE